MYLIQKKERTEQDKWYYLVVEPSVHKGDDRAKRLFAVELAMGDISSDIVVRKRSHKNCTIQIRISLASAVPISLCRLVVGIHTVFYHLGSHTCRCPKRKFIWRPYFETCFLQLGSRDF